MSPAVLLVLLLPAVTTASSLNTVSFEVSWGNGSVKELQFPWKPSSECLYVSSVASLACMQDHNTSDVINVWSNVPETLRYVSVSCLRQNHDQYHHGVCYCATVAPGRNVPYSFCLLKTLRNGAFNRTNNVEVLDLSDNRIDTIEPRTFYGLSRVKYVSLKGAAVSHLPYGIFCDTPALQFLDLSRMPMTVFPSHCFRCERNSTTDVRVLNLNGNGIKDLPRDSFEFLHRLVSLDLGNNKLEQLHRASFVGAGSLRYLNLSQNHLPSLFPDFCSLIPNLTLLNLERNAFAEFDFSDLLACSSLETLDLSYNNISAVHGNTSGLGEMQHFNISGNKIQVFDVDLSGLRDLQSLDMSLNLISKLKNNEFMGLENLSYLNLSFNKLGAMNNLSALFEPLSGLAVLDLQRHRILELGPSSFYRLQGLETLDLSHGSLQMLRPGSFIGLTKLKELDLSYNLIETVPESLFDQLVSLEVLKMSQNKIISMNSLSLPSLRVLELNSNKINTFPDLTNMSHLETLNLSDNSLNQLPSIALPRSSLVTLDLSFNELSALQEGFVQSFQSLQYLSMRRNRLTTVITTETFRDVNNLTYVDFSDNTVKLRSFVFDDKSLSNLQYLNLSKNPLGVLPPNLIPGNATQHSLKQLDLRYCNIKDVGPKTFQGLEALTAVDLSYNNIAVFQPFFVGYDTRPIFWMKGNPLVCDCTMTWLHDRQIVENYRLPACRAFTLDEVRPPVDLDPSQFLCKDTQGCDASCQCFKPSKTGDISIVVCRSRLHVAPDTVSYSTKALFLDGNAFSSPTALMPLTYLHNMKTKELYLNRSQVSVINERIFSEFSLLEILDLSDNAIASLPADTFAKQASLKQFYLRNNRLTKLPDHIFDHLQSLEELDISGNRLTTIQQPILKRLTALNLKYYFLSKNPWVCDCNSLDFKAFIDKVKFSIRDRRLLYCDWQRMLDLPKSSFQCSVTKHGGNVAQLAVGVLVGSVIFLVLLAVIVYFRRELCALVYAKTGIHFPRKNRFQSKPFDAYISYDITDKTCSDYVESTLLPRLRTDKFHLQTSAEIIPDIEVTKKALEDSQCSVFIVSRNFTSNPFFLKVFHIASDYSKLDKRFKAILIILNDIDLATMDPDVIKRLRKGDYITARSRLWWERLKYELPVPHPDGLRNNADDNSDSEVVVFSSINEENYQSV